MGEAFGDPDPDTPQLELVTRQEGHEPRPNRLTINQSVPPLQMLGPAVVGMDFRFGEPSFLQATGDEINFYAPNYDRPEVAHAYCIKFAADDTSMEAMLRTFKELCIRHKSSTGNILLELEETRFTRSHREEAKKLLAARAAKGAERSGPLSARASLPGQPSQQPHGNEATPSHADGVSGGAPAQDAAPIVCGQCNAPGHVAQACVTSNKNGLMNACPGCNTRGHTLDDCEFLVKHDHDDPVFIRNMLDVVVTQRANRPSIGGRKWKFPDVLDTAVNAGVVDNDAVLQYPWTTRFARAVRYAEPNDKILGGKLAPKSFDYKVHGRDHLPVDPLYHGKTVGQVIRMAWAGERELGTAPNQPKANPLRRSTRQDEPISGESNASGQGSRQEKPTQPVLSAFLQRQDAPKQGQSRAAAQGSGQDANAYGLNAFLQRQNASNIHTGGAKASTEVDALDIEYDKEDDVDFTIG